MSKVLSYKERQIIKWSKYWLNEKDKDKKSLYRKQVEVLNRLYFSDKQKQKD